MFTMSPEQRFGFPDDLSQVYNNETRGDLTVFNCQGIVGPGGFLVMRYLGDGEVKFGPMYEAAGAAGAYGPHFLYDDILVAGQHEGDGDTLAVYRINADLSLTKTASRAWMVTWPRSMLTDREQGMAFIYTGTSEQSMSEKVIIDRSGGITSVALDWIDVTGEWRWDDQQIRVSDSAFVDGATFVKNDESRTTTNHPVVFFDLHSGGGPLEGSADRLAPDRDVSFRQPVYATIGVPTSAGHILVWQGSDTFIEMSRNGYHLKIINSIPTSGAKHSLIDALWAFDDKLIAYANDRETSTAAMIRDVFGVYEVYPTPYSFSAARDAAGPSPMGVVSDGGFFLVTTKAGDYAHPDAKITVWYPGGGTFGLPPLRQVQRGDGLGSSVPRAVQNQSQQASLRAGRAFI